MKQRASDEAATQCLRTNEDSSETGSAGFQLLLEKGREGKVGEQVEQENCSNCKSTNSPTHTASIQSDIASISQAAQCERLNPDMVDVKIL